MKNEMSPYQLRKTANSPIEGVVVVDTETTGLEPGKDEVLSIAIVDIDGKELFYSLICPLERKRWPKAAEIHGITWKDVKGKPTIYDIGNEVSDILDSASLIVGYNVGFDIDMLVGNGLPKPSAPLYDLMEEYAQAYGGWSDRKHGYLWCKLEQCARKYGFDFAAHNALEDAKATAHCYKMFRAECTDELPAAIEREELEKKKRAKREAEAAAERAASEARNEATRKKKTTIKIVAVIVCLLSVVLFMNSCAIAGGGFINSFLFMGFCITLCIASIIVYFAQGE